MQSKPLSQCKIVFVHDWLVTYAGAERVLEQMINCFKDADVYAIVEDLKDNKAFIQDKEVKTSFIQNLPFGKKKYRTYLPIMPLAVEQFDLSEYDIVISSSHAVAKGVITSPNQLHICMCYSPIRYAWDLQFQYLKESKLERGIKAFFAKIILHFIRIWDHRTSNGVDEFISISKYIRRRILKTYRRDSTVIYPPVDINAFSLNVDSREDYYVTCSRFVPYKKIDLIVETFSKLHPEKKLVVIGEGPDAKKIKKLASSNIELLGYCSFDEVFKYLSSAKAFIFAAEEDFGIAPIEAQSCGTPVIAFGRGGALETIRGLDKKNPTGVFFYEQNIASISNAINSFEENKDIIRSETCHENAKNFSIERFNGEFKSFVKDAYNKFNNK